MKHLFAVSFMFLSISMYPAIAQESILSGNPVTSRKIDPLKTYWGDADCFLNRQAQALWM